MSEESLDQHEQINQPSSTPPPVPFVGTTTNEKLVELNVKIEALRENINDKINMLEKNLTDKINFAINNLEFKINNLDKNLKSTRNYIILTIIAVIATPLSRYFFNLP